MSFTHPTSVKETISNTSLFIEQGYIGGAWVSSGKTFPVNDPATDKPIAHIADFSAEDLKNAINHSEAAFKSFRRTTEHERSKMLHKLAALIRQNASDIAKILTLENGKTLAEAQGEVEYAATFLTWFAEEAIRSYGDIVPSQH